MLSGVLAANCIGLVAFYRLYALFSITFRKKRLDKSPAYVVIIFTAATQPNQENEHAAGEKQLRQAEGVTATRNTQPPPAGCAPSFVPGQRILRSQRRATGEIRDATTGPCGQVGGFPNGPGVWFLPPVILPSGICLRARWFARITSPEAWSEKRSQAHSGSDEVRGRAASPGAICAYRKSHSLVFTNVTLLHCAQNLPQYQFAMDSLGGRNSPFLTCPCLFFSTIES